MSQKVRIIKNNNKKSTAYNKFYAIPVYDNKFITTEGLADFIQTQCTVKRSDCKAVLDELGSAMKHYFELGQKIKLDGLGIFKVGITSAGTYSQEGANAGLVKRKRVLYAPETEAVQKGTASQTRAVVVDGEAQLVEVNVPVYNHVPIVLKDVRFELAYGGGYQETQEEPEP
jgi:predicted histone-like DNA-binding protein